MPQEVIDRIHILARRVNSARGGVEFVNRHGHPYVADNGDVTDDASDSDDDDSSFHPDPNDVAMDDDDNDDEFDNEAPAFADLNDPDHFDLVAAPAVEIAGVDNDNDNVGGIDIDEVNNDEGVDNDNDNVNAGSNENVQQIDPNLNPEQQIEDNINAVNNENEQKIDPNLNPEQQI
jgi:hypothetical protein